MKHTPAPWTHYDDTSSTGRHEIVALGKTIARVYRTNGDEVEDAANARLIAAAPALLSALEDAIPALIRLGDFVGNVDHGGASGLGVIDRCAVLLKAKEAIAAAIRARSNT